MPLRTPHDIALAGACELKFRQVGLENTSDPISDIVLFQFPPKIPSDNRKGNWSENDMPAGNEPYSVYETSGPREFSLNFTYIVENYSTHAGVIQRDRISAGGPSRADIMGSEWSIKKIKSQINLMRGYFARIRNKESSKSNLIIYFRYPYLTGRELWTCYLKGVDVKHGDTLIGGNDGDGNIAFPLRTDVTLDLRLWTKSQPESGDDSKETVGMPLKHQPEASDLWF